MKRLNNKGFAISTMLYGLLIIMVLMMTLLMNTMAFTRSNSRKFVSNIVDDLEKKKPKIILVSSKQKYYLNEKTDLDITIGAETYDVDGSFTKGSANDSGSIYIGDPTDLQGLQGMFTIGSFQGAPNNRNQFQLKTTTFALTKTGPLKIRIPSGWFSVDNEPIGESILTVGEVVEDPINISFEVKTIKDNNNKQVIYVDPGGTVFLYLNISRQSGTPVSDSIKNNILNKINFGFVMSTGGGNVLIPGDPGVFVKLYSGNKDKITYYFELVSEDKLGFDNKVNGKVLYRNYHRYISKLELKAFIPANTYNNNSDVYIGTGICLCDSDTYECNRSQGFILCN